MNGWGQAQSVPVYLVTQSGAQPSQATALANSLNVPPGMVTLTNGQITFLDPTNYQSIPMLPVTDPVVISNLQAQTLNRNPAIPLSFLQPDFGAISGLVPFPSNAAVSVSSAALNGAGLTPQGGTPTVTHGSVIARYTNESQTVLSVSNAVDTEVDYQFTVTAGYPLIGPGAQVQFNFATNGNTTRILYAARQLAPGPTVAIISSATASNRAAALYPGMNPQLTVQLVYYAPPLSLTSVVAIIPWYQISGTGTVSNAFSGPTTVRLENTLIPATDDTNFVPSLSLHANLIGGGMQVNANATVSGGARPYTYVWAGSDPATTSHTGAEIIYSPAVRAIPPRMFATLTSPVALALSWFDPPQFFVLEGSSNLMAGAWTGVTNPVSASNGVMTVTLDMRSGAAQFFRLRVAGSVQPKPETLALTVTDGNGVSVRTQQNFPTVLAQVLHPIDTTALNPIPGWGIESPYDPGIGTTDRQDWVTAMSVPTFGAQKILWIDYAASRHDFQNCLNSAYGVYDTEVGKADILFYVGHGNPELITFTGPWSPPYLAFNSSYGAWGNPDQIWCYDSPAFIVQNWMCLLSCDVLLEYTNVASTWGLDFDGLHLLLGFASDAWPGTGFPKVFAHNMGGGGPAVSIVQAWFDAAKACGAGKAAVLAPLGPKAACDMADYWWGQGKVGPTIRAKQITGWIYNSQ
jgi:hypothetical protein